VGMLIDAEAMRVHFYRNGRYTGGSCALLSKNMCAAMTIYSAEWTLSWREGKPLDWPPEYPAVG